MGFGWGWCRWTCFRMDYNVKTICKFKEAFVGTINNRAVYDYKKCVDIFVRENDISVSDSIQCMEEGVLPTYSSITDPLFIKNETYDYSCRKV